MRKHDLSRVHLTDHILRFFEDERGIYAEDFTVTWDDFNETATIELDESFNYETATLKYDSTRYEIYGDLAFQFGMKRTQREYNSTYWMSAELLAMIEEMKNEEIE